MTDVVFCGLGLLKVMFFSMSVIVRRARDFRTSLRKLHCVNARKFTVLGLCMYAEK